MLLNINIFERDVKKIMGFPGASDGKESACLWETWIQSLYWEDLLGKGMREWLPTVVKQEVI